MSELTVSKSVGNLRIETDLGDLMIRVYKGAEVVRQVDCHSMNLLQYTGTIAEISDEAQAQSTVQ